ncbi:hypothetical protein DL93DRAFT_2124130 [Clavulina sp. PMI_390]|nr:hypothetical protein DL93DRAFT_2124130 [Clavulina sp. PMI_390]
MAALYPGSMFTGSQRSGPNSYDVTVTIANTDFASSTVCGYLRIQNLTKDYPELTTYFHAEVIGTRYGFVTAEDWGATEQSDLTHWQRFPAFRSVRNDLKRPGLTMRRRERGTTFMRWKEKFLVPDHKTKEINGARWVSIHICLSLIDPRAAFLSLWSRPTAHPNEWWGSSPSKDHDAPAAISAFYFHPQSEPYQQLSLRHVPQTITGSFEFC